jgi:hypothetical protein
MEANRPRKCGGFFGRKTWRKDGGTLKKVKGGKKIRRTRG